jgi:hypothetical protein
MKYLVFVVVKLLHRLLVSWLSMIVSQGQQSLWRGIRSDIHTCHGLNAESEQQEEHRSGEEGIRNGQKVQ